MNIKPERAIDFEGFYPEVFRIGKLFSKNTTRAAGPAWRFFEKPRSGVSLTIRGNTSVSLPEKGIALTDRMEIKPEILQ